MDKLACSMMFQTIFLMILYGDISSQPLYENNREDQVTTKHTEFYYQKLYEREIFLENQVNNFKKELDICTDSTTSMEKLTTPNPMSGQNITLAETLPLDCKELYMNGIRKSGVYTIYPWEKTDPNCRPLQAYCDMETEGGGWTAIQRRVNGEESFNRNWTEYKLGFGTSYGDYWIGNDAIHQLTFGRNSSLYVTITPMNGSDLSFKMYHQFYLFGEDQNYRIQIGNSGSGNIGDKMKWYRWPFSTFDADHDTHAINCAAKYLGGWWFAGCHGEFLNGPWHSDDWSSPWYPQYSNGRQVNGTSMLIK
nr:ficolin-1 isoform X6 [Crassostrea gigas]